MDEVADQLWLDMLQGMENRACYFHNDNDEDGRNRNWYAHKVYGDQYTELKEAYQNEVLGDRKP